MGRVSEEMIIETMGMFLCRGSQVRVTKRRHRERPRIIRLRRCKKPSAIRRQRSAVSRGSWAVGGLRIRGEVTHAVPSGRQALVGDWVPRVSPGAIFIGSLREPHIIPGKASAISREPWIVGRGGTANPGRGGDSRRPFRTAGPGWGLGPPGFTRGYFHRLPPGAAPAAPRRKCGLDEVRAVPP